MRRLLLATVCILSATSLAVGQKVDSSLRAALGQWWETSPRYTADRGVLGISPFGGHPMGVVSDGANVWATVRLGSGGYLVQFRRTDGAVLGSWSDFPEIDAVLVAAGKVFFTTDGDPGGFYMFSPADSSSGPIRVADIGTEPLSIAYGGGRFWTADGNGTVSRITPGEFTPWEVAKFTGFQFPTGILYDGNNIWVTDNGPNVLFKLNTSTGAIVKTVPVGDTPMFPVFDGKHIWVPNHYGHSISVVDDATGTVTATLTGNGLQEPFGAAFDGKRVLVWDFFNGSVSLWNATDLSPIVTRSTGSGSEPWSACSDGIDFWIALSGYGGLGRF